MKIIRVAQAYDPNRLNQLAQVMRGFIHAMTSIENSIGSLRTETDLSKEELDQAIAQVEPYLGDDGIYAFHKTILNPNGTAEFIPANNSAFGALVASIRNIKANQVQLDPEGDDVRYHMSRATLDFFDMLRKANEEAQRIYREIANTLGIA